MPVGKIQLALNNARKAYLALHPQPIVCHDLKLLYYPVPKVASTSIKNYLLNHSEIGRSAAIPRDASGNRAPSVVHSFEYPRISTSAAEVLRLNGYLSFAIVRDPIDRIWSCYCDKITDRRNANLSMHPGFKRYNTLTGRSWFSNEMSFEAFLNAIALIPDALADEHFRSQYRFLPLHAGKVALDELIHVEELDVRFNSLLERHLIAGKLSVRSNSAASKKPSLVLTPELRNKIERRYKRDLSLLGYSL
jgi:hypothetical protein